MRLVKFANKILNLSRLSSRKFKIDKFPYLTRRFAKCPGELSRQINFHFYEINSRRNLVDEGDANAILITVSSLLPVSIVLASPWRWLLGGRATCWATTSRWKGNEACAEFARGRIEIRLDESGLNFLVGWMPVSAFPQSDWVDANVVTFITGIHARAPKKYNAAFGKSFLIRRIRSAKHSEY